MNKQKMVEACKRFNLIGMATALVASNDDSEEGMAATMAGEVKAEADKRVNEHPLIQACALNGVASAADFTRLLDSKKLADKVTEELRAEAHALAISAYGPELGPKVSAQVDHMEYAAVKTMRDSYAATVDAKFPAGKRQTAPNGAVAMTEDETPEPKTAWEKLSEEQKAYAAQAGHDTDEKRETYAKNVLEATK